MGPHNNIWKGVILGLLLPIVGYALFLSLFEWMTAEGISKSFSGSFNQRTPPLLGIVCNLIPFHYFNKNFEPKSMRGLMMPTIAYVIVWAYFYAQPVATMVISE